MSEERIREIAEAIVAIDDRRKVLAEQKIRVDQESSETKARLGVLRRKAARSGLYSDREEFEGLTKRQRKLGAASQQIQLEQIYLKDERRRLNIERKSLTSIDSTAAQAETSLVEALGRLRSKYEDFAGDMTRVSSMRAMASRFVKEIGDILSISDD